MQICVDELEPGWRPDDEIFVDLPDEQVARCRIVNVTEDGTVQVVPEHEVVAAKTLWSGSLRGQAPTDRRVIHGPFARVHGGQRWQAGQPGQRPDRARTRWFLSCCRRSKSGANRPVMDITR